MRKGRVTWIVFAAAVDAHGTHASQADHGADGFGGADPIAASIVNRRVIHAQHITAKSSAHRSRRSFL